jgi:hypothetical protein
MSEVDHSVPQPKQPRSQLWRGIAWLTLWAIGILGVIVNPSEPFKGCVHNDKYRAQYEELHQDNAGFIAKLTRFYLRSRLVAVCTANFADQNDRVIGALAAIALAVFTLYLWRATHGLRRYAGIQAGDMQSFLQAMRQLRAAAAAQESALRDQAHATTRIANATLAQLRVLIAREAPVLSWNDFKLEPVGSGIAVSGISPDRDYRPVATVKNIGRSPLELRAFCIETIRGEFRTDCGTGPQYTDITPLNSL